MRWLSPNGMVIRLIFSYSAKTYFPFPILGASSPRIFHAFKAELERFFTLFWGEQILRALSMIRVPYFSVDIENSNKPYIQIDTHDTFEDLPIIHPGMAMEKLFLVILHFAFIRTVVISGSNNTL